MINISLIDEAGAELAIQPRQITGLSIESDAIQVRFDASLIDALAYIRQRVQRVVVTAPGRRWTYRATEPRLMTNGVEIVGIGPAYDIDDAIYCALWSTTKTDVWEPMTNNQISTYDAGKWDLDQNNRIYLGVRKGTTYNASVAGGQTYAIPHRSSRPLTAVIFDFELTATAVGWIAELYATDDAFAAPVRIFQFPSIIGTQTGHRTILCGNVERIFAAFQYISGSTIYAGETGSTRFVLTNVRVVTGLTGLISTTIPLGVGAIGSQVVTPASMAGIVIGSKLTIGNTGAEEVTVTATTATTFTATFTTTHPVGVKVAGWNGLTAREIAADVVADAAPLGGIRNTTALVAQDSSDQTEAEWINVPSSQVLGDLAERLGWFFKVRSDRVVQVAPAGTYGRAWLVNFDDIELARAYDFVNVARATYEDSAGTFRQTTDASDSISQSVLGVQRQGVIEAPTTSASQALSLRDQYLTASRWRGLRARYAIRQVLVDGRMAPKLEVQPGDTIRLAKLGPWLNYSQTQAISFIVDRVRYDALGDVLEVEPLLPLPTLDVLLAQKENK